MESQEEKKKVVDRRVRPILTFLQGTWEISLVSRNRNIPTPLSSLKIVPDWKFHGKTIDMPQNLDMRSIERGTNFSHVSSTTILQREGKKFQADKFTRLFSIRLRIQSLRHITRCRTRSRKNDRIRQRRKTSRGIGSLSWSSLPRMSSPIRINNPPPLSENKITHYAHKKTEYDTLGPLSRNLRRFSLTRRNRTSSWYVFFLLPPINLFVCCFPRLES